MFTLGVGKTGLRRFVELAFFVGLVAWMTEVALYALQADFRLFPSPLDTVLLDAGWVRPVGVLSVMLGLVVFVLALLAFGRSWRIGIDEQTPGDLVTGGIFAFSRNPLFLFIDLYFFGTFLINGTLIFLLFAVVTALGLHYQILQEERFLAGSYGQAYRNYCANVGRYVTWRGV